MIWYDTGFFFSPGVLYISLQLSFFLSFFLTPLCWEEEEEGWIGLIRVIIVSQLGLWIQGNYEKPSYGR